MKNCFRYLAAVLVCLAATAVAAADRPQNEPISPGDKVITLFNGKDFTGLYTWLKGAGRSDDPHLSAEDAALHQKVFTVENGMIHVSGEGAGYVATEERVQGLSPRRRVQVGQEDPTARDSSATPASSCTAPGRTAPTPAASGWRRSNASSPRAAKAT